MMVSLCLVITSSFCQHEILVRMSAAEVVRLEKEDYLNWLLAPTFSQWSALGEGDPFHHLRTLT